jgi:hypothetical protein
MEFEVGDLVSVIAMVPQDKGFNLGDIGVVSVVHPSNNAVEIRFFTGIKLDFDTRYELYLMKKKNEN